MVASPQNPERQADPPAPAPLLRPPRTLLTSYAQSFEDVLLHRVFGHLDTGFYVDIGAYDPVIGSVTKLLYDRGWSGINIEPGSAFPRLVAQRPRDVNLNIAILDEKATVTFVENTTDPGASHVEGSIGAEHGAEEVRTYSVACDRLDRVLAEHAGDRLINLMKIDAEGSETRIVQSTDWLKIRPQVLVIEAVAPWTNELISQGWEPKLLSSGYRRAYFDGINLFFVREEDADLLRHFDRPVNVLDWFAKYDPVKNDAVVKAEFLQHLEWKFSGQLERVPKRLSDQLQQPAGEASAGREAGASYEFISGLAFDRVATALDEFADLAEKYRRLNWNLAAQVDRIPPRLRGLVAERGREGKDTETEFAVPEPDALLDELQIALSYTLRFDRVAAELDQMLRRRRSLTGSPDETGAWESERANPERLQDELRAAIEAAIRCDRIVTQFRDPGGPRALRLVLPLGRLLRSGHTISAGKRSAGRRAYGEVPKTSFVASALGTTLRKLGSLLNRMVRPIVHPLATRTRDFMIEPLRPMVGQLGQLTHDVDLIRRVLLEAQQRDQVSPDLIKSIESLLLTLAALNSRR